MIFVILLLLTTIYIYQLLLHFFKLKELKLIFCIFNNYFESCNLIANKYMPEKFTKKKNYLECLSKLLSKVPSMNEYLSEYTLTALRHGVSDATNYRSAAETFYTLQDVEAQLAHEFRSSFNPLTSIKKTLFLPATFLKWVGFSPKCSFSKIFSILVWIAIRLIELYSIEIKQLITSLFK
jgi:hypothetical protein